MASTLSPGLPRPFAARALRAFALPLLHSSPALLARLSGPAPEKRGERLDPQVAALLAVGARVSPPPDPSRSLAQRRAQLELDARVLEPDAPVLGEVRELTVQGAEGRLPARLYLPLPPAPKQGFPLLVFFHGGGWMVGSLDSHDTVCRVLCARADCAVLSVAYRLAPEHPFPAGVRDAEASYRDAFARAAQWRADPSRMAVGGDSAGGNLSALTALALRREPCAPKLQLLFYAALDLRRQQPSFEEYGQGFLLEREGIDHYLDHYLPDLAVRASAAASPLLAPLEHLREVAPAHLQTAGFDPLRDEGFAYAARLTEAGVPVEHRHYAGQIHGYLQMAAGVDAVWSAYHDAVGALRVALHQR